MNGRKTALRPAPAVTGWRRGRSIIGVGCVLALVGALAITRTRSLSIKPAARSLPAAGAAVAGAAAEPERFQPIPLPIALPRSTPAAAVSNYAPPPIGSAPLAAPTRVESPPIDVAPTSSSTALPIRSSAPPSKPHRAPFALLAAWSKPGLCSSASAATQVRDTLTASFRIVEPDDGGKLYLDPRLPTDAEQPLLAELRRAEAETAKRLGLRPARPLVFVYADQPLMNAAACINENVVAFYDGALHVVANRADLQQSVLHEYTHHALFSSGFITPAWAQEGIAMSIAQERWWRDPRYLQALIANPFSLEQMDRTIPYKLPSEQAVAFYVQSAVLVECLLQARRWSPADLLAALRAGSSADALSYDLPELDQRGFLPGCLQGSGH